MYINGKPIKLTKVMAWDWCLKQWDLCIFLDVESDIDISTAKDAFLKANGINWIENSCFFCEYVKQNGGFDFKNCYKKCPGARISKYKPEDGTLWCEQSEQEWCDNPQEFYKYLKKCSKKA